MTAPTPHAGATPGPLVRRWVVVNAPNGIEVHWTNERGEPQGPICHMRWDDGLRPHVKGAIQADAEIIASAPALAASNVALRAALERLLAWLDEEYPAPTYSREVALRQAGRAALAPAREGTVTP